MGMAAGIFVGRVPIREATKVVQRFDDVHKLPRVKSLLSNSELSKKNKETSKRKKVGMPY